MDIEKQILLMLDYIERELIAIRKSSEPVSLFELLLFPLERLWAVFVAAYAGLSRINFKS